jgi:hypothetical protein
MVSPKLLPDNSVEDSYLYELLVLTGSKAQATCKSKVRLEIPPTRAPDPCTKARY